MRFFRQWLVSWLWTEDNCSFYIIWLDPIVIFEMRSSGVLPGLFFNAVLCLSV